MEKARESSVEKEGGGDDLLLHHLQPAEFQDEVQHDAPLGPQGGSTRDLLGAPNLPFARGPRQEPPWGPYLSFERGSRQGPPRLV